MNIKSIYASDKGLVVQIIVPEEGHFMLLSVEEAIPFLNRLLAQLPEQAIRQAFSRHEDEAMRLAGAPMLPGMEA